MLPFPGVLVPLSAYFATDKPEGRNYNATQKEQLLRWFWRSLFSRRFSSDVNERQAIDIVEMKKLAADPQHPFKHPKAEIKLDFTKNLFSTANANSRVHILLLSSANAYSFISGAKVDPAKVLKKASKHEFHHIFPQKFLLTQGKTSNEINVLANICFLTRADNNHIRAKAPDTYLIEVGHDKIDQYLASAFCPLESANLSYEDFLTARAELLIAEAQRLMA